jgi:hypothetical protein
MKPKLFALAVIAALVLAAWFFRYGDPQPGPAPGLTYVKDRWTGATLICGFKDIAAGGRPCLERMSR